MVRQQIHAACRRTVATPPTTSQWAFISLGRAVDRRSFPPIAKGRRDFSPGGASSPVMARGGVVIWGHSMAGQSQTRRPLKKPRRRNARKHVQGAAQPVPAARISSALSRRTHKCQGRGAERRRTRSQPRSHKAADERIAYHHPIPESRRKPTAGECPDKPDAKARGRGLKSKRPVSTHTSSPRPASPLPRRKTAESAPPSLSR